MSKRQAKRLNLALYLNPVISDADRVAMDALQHWYEKTKQSYPDPENADLDTVVRIFHHDIYLAGLHLYLINPRLCRFVAEALAQGEISMAALVQQLAACGLWPPQEESAGAAAPSTFSAAQLEQLEQLLAAQSSRTAAADAPSTFSPAQLQQLEQLLATLPGRAAEADAPATFSPAQLEQLERLLAALPGRAAEADAPASFSAAQLEQLEQLLASLPERQAEAPADQAATAADPALLEQLAEQQALLARQHELLTEQRDQLNQQQARLAEQGKQLSSLLEELQKLRALAQDQARQLQQLRLAGNGAAAPAAEPARGPVMEEMAVSDMSTKLAQMEKVRKKGLF